MIDFYTEPYGTRSQQAAIMLEESGIAYRAHCIDMSDGAQLSAELLAINPAGMLPAIVDHDAPRGAPLVLAQSGAIVLYLAERSGRLLPADPVRRAQALQWFMHAYSEVAANSTAMVLARNYPRKRSPENAAFLDTSCYDLLFLDFSYIEDELLRVLAQADAQLARHEYLAGEISVADVALYPLFVRRKYEIDKANAYEPCLTALQRWAARMAKRPAVQKAMKACR